MASSRPMRMRAVAALSLFLATACGDDSAGPFDVRPTVAMLYVTHAPPMTELAVVDATGTTVATATTDELGSLIFRELAPGKGYRVTTTAPPIEQVGNLEVKSIESSAPPTSLYTKQKLVAGNQYITTRDGTTLSAFVTMPGPIEEGPYPTVVTYSGYDEARPGKPVVDDSLMGLCSSMPILCAAPSNPSALIAGLFGYATVSVNVRGTGCSGGAFDYFETMELLDGYDIIETVAAQSWVMNGKVGMVGLSYPGITQLFVAAQQPPHLAGIAPMSVIGNSATTMLPGGILNDGFATQWITAVISKALPYGQGWEQGQVDGGDKVCSENQLLHEQYVDNVAVARKIKFYDPAQHDKYNPTTFVDKIQVPVFFASAWEDEQTGPYFFSLLDKFTGSPAVHETVYNGVHVDAFQPSSLEDWYDFLELFVAQRVPVDHPLQRSLAPMLFQQVFQTSNLELHASKYLGAASAQVAQDMWKAQPRLRALFESGNGGAPGEPKPTFEKLFTQWPPTETTPLRLYAQPDGGLAATQPTTTAPALTFTLDPAAGERVILENESVWDLLPHYTWHAPAPGSAVMLESAALTADQVMLGTASVDLWLRSPVTDADLEVSLIEVRPDGQEMYVQSGWVRASLSASGPDATATWPAPTFMEKDAKDLVPGTWTPIRVGTAGFQHVFRAGSKIRISIDTPGDSRVLWKFSLATFTGNATPTYEIGVDSAHPTSVVLPVLGGVTAPSTLPPCPSLRGQQCRTYAPYTNTPGT